MKVKKVNRGMLITFEKTRDGLGGTTQAKHLAERLKKEGYEVVLTHEPGGTEIGKTIRQIVKHYPGELGRATELLLFQADRAQHYKEVLKPSLLSGKIILCDRYFDSTLVYQGAGRGWNDAILWKLHKIATNLLLPDLTFVLDGTPPHRPPDVSRFEKLPDKFFERVREGMLKQAKTASRYTVIEANAPEEDIAAAIFDIVKYRLSLL